MPVWLPKTGKWPGSRRFGEINVEKRLETRGILRQFVAIHELLKPYSKPSQTFSKHSNEDMICWLVVWNIFIFPFHETSHFHRFSLP